MKKLQVEIKWNNYFCIIIDKLININSNSIKKKNFYFTSIINVIFERVKDYYKIFWNEINNKNNFICIY